jgi:hypothetical protein
MRNADGGRPRDRHGTTGGPPLRRRSILATGASVGAASAGCSALEDSGRPTTGDPSPVTDRHQQGQGFETLSADEINGVSIARDGAHLEELVADLSAGDVIRLKPDTIYEIDDTLQVRFDQDEDSGKFRIEGPLKATTTAIKPTGDFTAIDLAGADERDRDLEGRDRSGWLGGVEIGSFAVDASNLTAETDVLRFNRMRFFQVERILVVGGSFRDGFHFGERDPSGNGTDTFSGGVISDCHVAGGERYHFYVGTSSSVRLLDPILHGAPDVHIRLLDANDVWVYRTQCSMGGTPFLLESRDVRCRNVRIQDFRVEGQPPAHTFRIGDGYEHSPESGIERVDPGRGYGFNNVQIEGAIVAAAGGVGALLEGNVRSLYFDQCLWQHRNPDDVCIEVADDRVSNVVLSPLQHFSDDRFPVEDPQNAIRYVGVQDATDLSVPEDLVGVFGVDPAEDRFYVRDDSGRAFAIEAPSVTAVEE